MLKEKRSILEDYNPVSSGQINKQSIKGHCERTRTGTQYEPWLYRKMMYLSTNLGKTSNIVVILKKICIV